MLKSLLELTKPRISAMVGVTTALGWRVAGGVFNEVFVWTLVGTVLSAASCGALNQWLEQDVDALMTRTLRRPLPSGRIRPAAALAFGVALGAAGLGLLWFKSNGPAFAWTALTLVLYLGLYTPLKRVTPHSTWIGAVAGATPPLIGWAAVRGWVGPEAWALFGIQFLWQIPHFLAMFWMYRDDYARAGFKVMPVVDPGGRLTALQIALHSMALLPASLLPSYLGMAGALYAFSALVLGTAFLGFAMRASWTLAATDARRLFLASLVYLPSIFTMVMIGGSR